MKYSITSLSIILSLLFSTAAIAASDSADSNMDIWLVSSLHRVFPQSHPEAKTELELLAARNSRISFQVAFHSNMKDQTHITCSIEDTADLSPEIRYVGLVPMPHFNTDVSKEELAGIGYLPGWLPDPLYPLTHIAALYVPTC